jgi:hypothetical protein
LYERSQLSFGVRPTNPLMAHIKLGLLHRRGVKNVGRLGGSQTERASFDFIIDGVSLYELLDAQNWDLVGALGWLPADANSAHIDQLLLRADAPVPGGRRMVFICSECGDIGCGAITCEIIRGGGNVTWQNFGFENNYDDAIDLEPFRDVGPFHFEWDEYCRVLEAAVSAAV